MTDQDDATTKAEKTPLVGERPHGHVADTTHQATPWPAITIGIVGTVFVLAAIAVAWLQFFSLGNEASYEAATYNEQRGQYYEGDEPNLREYGDRHGQVVASGVVSEINGDTMIVIGGGDKVSVKRSSTTRIVGGEKSVSVNDTVVIFGSRDEDGAVYAARIMVHNDSLQDEPSSRDVDPRSRLPSA